MERSCRCLMVFWSMARGHIGTMTPSSLMTFTTRPSKLSQVLHSSLIFSSIIDFTINYVWWFITFSWCGRLFFSFNNDCFVVVIVYYWRLQLCNRENILFLRSQYWCIYEFELKDSEPQFGHFWNRGIIHNEAEFHKPWHPCGTVILIFCNHGSECQHWLLHHGQP
jgi:hypothetical protein